jgi:hypothetical protein
MNNINIKDRKPEENVIPGFKEMSKQQLFDMSARHILTTRQKSMISGGAKCIYSGLGCAAAPFLLPEVRKSADNRTGTTWRALADIHHVVPYHEVDFIAELQHCHDCADQDYFMTHWESSTRRLANKYGLSIEVLKEGSCAGMNGC